ncbi:uncharacterized protein CC84DRAFT_1176361 [Paraphaeosphaeria sporulosa]|uniref:Uncharacterized protein n=1 Tax=Paraphaeosphaeria sporulosa TaxID=1460663 RepID=A0A177CHL8_9PLEO|nr:uncharacterized protein CC84DRAFT_1176361 [Paraphaeosphaeria sporulosa]OAG06348.1 hypothetical protein CC84DRAFT_1176361 [Paraphaeosphaeria sporulosa]
MCISGDSHDECRPLTTPQYPKFPANYANDLPYGITLANLEKECRCLDRIYEYAWVTHMDNSNRLNAYGAHNSFPASQYYVDQIFVLPTGIQNPARIAGSSQKLRKKTHSSTCLQLSFTSNSISSWPIIAVAVVLRRLTKTMFGPCLEKLAKSLQMTKTNCYFAITCLPARSIF